MRARRRPGSSTVAVASRQKGHSPGLESNTVTLVSRAAGTDGATGNDASFRPAISADGRFVVFSSEASNLHADDSDTTRDVFARDLQENTTTLVSRAAGPDGANGDGSSQYPAISADGRLVAFYSQSSNLHPDDADDDRDVFVRDLRENTTTLVSRAAGADGAKGDDDSGWSAISADGRFVGFESSVSNLHPDDGDTGTDVFMRDLETNATTLVSRAAGDDGANGDGSSEGAAVSADGRFVAFESRASNLHPDDDDTTADVFRRDVLGPLPEAVGDAYQADEDTPLAVAAPGVLANDTDPEGDTLTAQLVAAPAHGNVTLNRDGSLHYMPDPGYHGSDSLTYRASDGILQSAPATVTIDVKAVEDPTPVGTTGPAPAGTTPPPPAPPARGAEPAISQLGLAARCVRCTATGKVRVQMTLRMARSAPLQIQIDRAAASKGRRSCARPNPTRNRARRETRFRKVATLRRSPTAAAAAGLPTPPGPAGRHRLTLDLRLTPGLYRLTVRAQLDHDRLSPPARRYLRVVG
jgi:hypothetical protein